jgi:hypothetical protein
VSALCLFVDDLDPSNAGFGLRFIDLQMNSRSKCSWQGFAISGVVGSLRPKFLGHILSLGCSSSPQNFVSRLQVVWEIHRSKFWGCFAG